MNLFLRVFKIGIGLFLILLGAYIIFKEVVLLLPGIALMYIGVYIITKYDKGE